MPDIPRAAVVATARRRRWGVAIRGHTSLGRLRRRPSRSECPTYHSAHTMPPHPEGHPMNIRRLGRTGLKGPEACLGTMTFGYQCDEETAFAIMNKAADRGVTFLDTADVYPVPPSPDTAGRTEEIVGRWLTGQRDRYVLATK